MIGPKVLINDDGIRPAGKPDECFYCRQKIGANHNHDCVAVHKMVKVRAVIEYEVEVPASWDKESIEFQRNEGSWCSDNMINEIEALDGCLCNYTDFEYLEDVGVGGYAKEAENKDT